MNNFQRLKNNNFQIIESLGAECFIEKIYPTGEIIVNDGKFVQTNKELNYSLVPLGYIESGKVSVTIKDKETKLLTRGDFIGLFETVDYLQSDSVRQIGRWKLTAEAETKIRFINKKCIDKNIKDSEIQNHLKDLIVADDVPLPITDQPLLDWVARHTTRELKNTAIAIHTHLLPNHLPLFEHLASLVGAANVYIIGKTYSTDKESELKLKRIGFNVIALNHLANLPYSFAVKGSIEVMWHMILENQGRDEISKVLILDDGSDVWTSIPWDKIGDLKIAGTEQTQRGITRIKNTKLSLPPIVSVATSTLKKEIESYFIGEAVVKKIIKCLELHDVNQATIGIVGMGSIGSTICNQLAELGYQIETYDSTFGGKTRDTLDDLINSSDVIIGNTGTDCLQGIAWNRISGEKIFISSSSADVEFRTILDFGLFKGEEDFADKEIFIHRDLKVVVINGGYPINFDRDGNATETSKIIMTRCLIFIGMMQAASLLDSSASGGIYELDPTSQKNLFGEWQEMDKELTTIFKSDDIKNTINDLISSEDQKTIWY